MSRVFGKRRLQEFALFETRRHMDVPRDVIGIEVDLLEQGSQELRWLEFLQIFPIEFPAVNDSASSDMEQIRGNLRRLRIPGEHINVLAGGGRDFLPFLHILDRAD